MTIYFFSDPHYGHKNYTSGISSWPDKTKCRQFDTLDDMNNAVVRQINDKIGPNDEAYCLGDWNFGVKHNAKIFRDRLHCKKIHLILGNHDTQKGGNFVIPDSQDSNGKHLFFYDLFESVSNYKEIFLNKKRICMFHYPIASWNEMASSIHLFGHTHSRPEDRFFNGGKSMDVGLDGGGPYSVDEIMEIMASRPIKREGHHVNLITEH
jgi:calcineurin-like phosphoesterase family protein